MHIRSTSLRLAWRSLAGAVVIPVIVGHFAVAAGTNATVSGTVSQDGTPIKNAAVQIICAADTNTYTHNTTSSSTGHYSTSFPVSDCPSGGNVMVSANNGAASATATGVMGDTLALTLNLPLVGAALPEFTVVTWLVSAFTLLLGVLILRRQKVATTQQ